MYNRCSVNMAAVRSRLPRWEGITTRINIYWSTPSSPAAIQSGITPVIECPVAPEGTLAQENDLGQRLPDYLWDVLKHSYERALFRARALEFTAGMPDVQDHWLEAPISARDWWMVSSDLAKVARLFRTFNLGFETWTNATYTASGYEKDNLSNFLRFFSTFHDRFGKWGKFTVGNNQFWDKKLFRQIFKKVLTWQLVNELWKKIFKIVLVVETWKLTKILP